MKYALAVLGLLVFAAVAVPAQTPPAPAPDQVPSPLAAVSCTPVAQTPLETAGGSTCTLARQALHGELDTDANCVCGFCSRQYVDQQCTVIQGGYSMSGYLRYSCVICLD